MQKAVEKMSLEELSALVGVYPWFASARLALCRRLIEAGGWSREELGNTLLHISDSRILRELVLPLRPNTTLPASAAAATPASAPPARKRVAGGDFFTREEYEKVRTEEDRFVPRSAAEPAKGTPSDTAETMDFISETLAGIYAQQGYPAQAREIYEKLILAYPEKSAYFAALIEKLNE